MQLLYLSSSGVDRGLISSPLNVEVYNEESNNGMNYRDATPAMDRADTPAIDRQDSIDPPFHIPGLSLPISVRLIGR